MIVAIDRGSFTGMFSEIMHEGVVLVGLREVISLMVFQSSPGLSLLLVMRFW
jgi:hypothetical protein